MTTSEENKAKRINKAKYDTHVNLLMIRNGLSKNDAIVTAYIQGPGGLDKLVAPVVPVPK